ncbi:MAG: porin family protein [Gammaproteobacteria bacterium]|nr:porin family protein [Gammaproteobacteria bacterium]
MKKILYIFSSLSSLCIAATPIDGLYLSGYGGGAYLPGNIDRTSGSYYFNQSQYDTGFDAGAALGYKSDAWRIEAELNFIKANLKNINLNGLTLDIIRGYSQSTLGLVNANYDLPMVLGNIIQAYIGGGLGYGWLQTNYSHPTFIQEQIHNTSFAYQGTAGLLFHITEMFTLGLNYRYLSTTHINTLGSRFQANLLNGSLTYHFDRNNS